MAYINDEEINEIRSRADIVDIIGEYIELKQKGRNFFAQCPFHGNGNERTPSLSVSRERQMFNCFACGTGGNVFAFIMKYEDVTFPEALKIVANKVGYNLNVSDYKEFHDPHDKDYEIMDYAKKYYLNNIWTEEGKGARKYLLDRGIDETIIKEFNIGYAGSNKDTLYRLLSKKNYDLDSIDNLGLINKSGLDIYDTFTNRIIIPIENARGQVVGFTGRIFNGESDTAKYLNTRETPIFKKGSILFNFHNAKDSIKANREVIVVEGNMDAISLSARGIKNVVALQGTALAKDNIEQLKKLNATVILMLDNDSAGLEATIKNSDLLINNGIMVKIVRLNGAKDPDEYIRNVGVDALKDNIKHALKYIDFKLEYLKIGKNMQNIEDVATYINEVIKALNNEDDLTKSLIISKISKDYQIDAAILESKIKVTPQKVEAKTVKKEEKKSKYQLAANKIIYYMLMDSKYITIYQNRLGFFKEKIERVLASEIVYFNREHGYINIPDFTTYIMPNSAEYDFVLKIINDNETTEINDEEFNACINVILEILKRDEIIKLKEQIKSELDVNKKLELITRLTEIKKEV